MQGSCVIDRVAWVDLQRAFYKVWIDGLIIKLMRNGVANNMFKWIQSYLFNRRARVSLDQLSSRKILLRQGVPQGGVLVFINDLVSELPRGVKAALYADDLVLWCKEEHARTANYRIQQAIDQLTAWTEDWCVTVNKDKSSAPLFPLSPKKQASPIKIVTHLGVTFDKRLTWKPHTLRTEGRARKKLVIMRKLAGTTWGANEQILKTVYEGSVRPVLE